MALSSLRKGQTVLQCQVCEEEVRIKWRCLECNFYMCQKCKKIHQKLKSSVQHKIVDLKNVEADAFEPGDIQHLDFAHIKCLSHTEQTCCLFCRDCEKVVCPSCITDYHNKHTMTDIQHGFKVSADKIRTLTSEIDKEIDDFTSDVSDILEGIKFRENSKYEIQKKKILGQEQVLKDAVVKETQALLHELNSRWEKLNISIKDEENSAKQTVTTLELRKKNLNKALESNNALLVFKTLEEHASIKQHKAVNTKQSTIPKFFPWELNSFVIKSILGEFKDVEDMHPNVLFQIKKQYTTNLPSVSNLACCLDGSLWTNNFITGMLQNTFYSGNEIQINHTIKLWVADMAIKPSGDLLLSTLQPSLKVIKKETGKVKTSRYNVAPLVTTCIHVSVADEVLIGAREDGPDFPKLGPRQVILMGLDKRPDVVYEFDADKQPLFTYPYKVATDSSNNVFVIDRLSSDFNGRVVILHQEGGVKGLYTGYPLQKFTPLDIAVTSSDQLIVADDDNHMLHVLNNTGYCVMYQNVKDLGMQWPVSIDIDSKGLLLVGCNTYKDMKDAKIYVVDISRLKNC